MLEAVAGGLGSGETDESSHEWVTVARKILQSALGSKDGQVRRAAGETLASLAVALGEGFTQSVTSLLQTLVKQKGTANASVTTCTRAGAVFALACIRRAIGSMRGALLVSDASLYDVARETAQPLRTWALHSWWLLVNTAGNIDFVGALYGRMPPFATLGHYPLVNLCRAPFCRRPTLRGFRCGHRCIYFRGIG